MELLFELLFINFFLKFNYIYLIIILYDLSSNNSYVIFI